MFLCTVFCMYVRFYALYVWAIKLLYQSLLTVRSIRSLWVHVILFNQTSFHKSLLMAERDTRNQSLISASNDLYKSQIKVLWWSHRSQFMKEKTSWADVRFVKTCWQRWECKDHSLLCYTEIFLTAQANWYIIVMHQIWFTENTTEILSLAS